MDTVKYATLIGITALFGIVGYYVYSKLNEAKGVKKVYVPVTMYTSYPSLFSGRYRFPVTHHDFGLHKTHPPHPPPFQAQPPMNTPPPPPPPK